MEHIASLDVSWMTHGSSKEKIFSRSNSRRSSVTKETLSNSNSTSNRESHPLTQTAQPNPNSSSSNGNATPSSSTNNAPAPTSTTPSPASNAPEKDSKDGKEGKETHALPIPLLRRSNSARTLLGGSSSDDRKPVPSPPQRRNSWFANISSKFSSSSSSSHNQAPPAAATPAATSQSPPQTSTAAAKPAEFVVPKITPARNAVLQHAAKHDGDGPYIPAPPRTGPTGGLLQVFRRLSSSSSSANLSLGKAHNHGLVERRVLNVDKHRERCAISGLDQAKLRRVAFCVDVEIAPMPRYVDDEKGKAGAKKKDGKKAEGAGAAGAGAGSSQGEQSAANGAQGQQQPVKTLTAAEAKKKEKKKKSEEERKARKEKRRLQAEANGTIPMELHYDSDSSSSGTTPTAQAAPNNCSGTPGRTQPTPTTNPVRIYRRCCQLRETPILKKITEQLGDPANASTEYPGMVEKLDLTGYWLQLTDLITLGDYLAVVPIRELILDGCGLTDEGLRVILAGLLAAKKTRPPVGGRLARKRRGSTVNGEGELLPGTEQGGVVERLVLRNNKFGPEGWKHLCLFVYLCRTLRMLDLEGVPFPKQTAIVPEGQQSVAQLLSKSLGERLGGATLSLLGLGNTGLSAEQLGLVIDGVVKCGVRRLNLANNGIDAEGLRHVARFIKSGVCEGLDLGGNDLSGEGLVDILEAAVGEAAAMGEEPPSTDPAASQQEESGKEGEESMPAERENAQRESIEGKEGTKEGSISSSKETKPEPMDCPLWALSLADCNLTPSSLCKLLPALARLKHFRFLDLSHNQDLFRSDPSAVGVLRRYLPKFPTLKRIHLADCSMSPEQAIALSEILPEIPGLAHISLLGNPQLAELATNATTEEAKEEACALFASLLAAARVSTSLVAVDIEDPSEKSTDLVKALAKQVVAYCLRNMELAAAATPGAQPQQLQAQTVAEEQGQGQGQSQEGEIKPMSKPVEPEYPDVLQRLVGHDVNLSSGMDPDVDAAPDDDYVIGGTGVVKALACCLKNRGDGEDGLKEGESAGEMVQANGAAQGGSSGAKAKETSKHLLLSARKIRLRLQPAINKARAAGTDTHAYHRLMFLDQTLANVIKRFETEFPDTRLPDAPPTPTTSTYPGADLSAPDAQQAPLTEELTKVDSNSTSNSDSALTGPDGATTAAADPTSGGYASDDGQDADEGTELIISPPLSRSNSLLSLSSKALANEEARVLRAGHTFRASFVAVNEAGEPQIDQPLQGEEDAQPVNGGYHQIRKNEDDPPSPRTVPVLDSIVTDLPPLPPSPTSPTSPMTTTRGSRPQIPHSPAPNPTDTASSLESSIDLINADPRHARLLHELLDELGDETLKKEAAEKGISVVFKLRRREIREQLRQAAEKSEEGEWERWVESLRMARVNIRVGDKGEEMGAVDESAVED